MNYLKCRFCGSTDVANFGSRKTRQDRPIRTVLFCNDCEQSFSVEEKTITEKAQKEKPKFYDNRNWQIYNKNQVEEFRRFQEIAFRLINNRIPEYEAGFGRPKANLREIIFCLLAKIYFNRSSRRLVGVLEDAKELALIEKIWHFNTILKYLNQKEVNELLKALIEDSCKEVKIFDEIFAVDSTGFSVSMYESWFNARFERPSKRRLFRKVHIMIGTKSRIITAVKITDGFGSDTKQLPELLNKTKQNFKIAQLVADKGYLSRSNYQIIEQAGGIPYIPFTSQVTEEPRESKLWEEMMYKYHLQPEEYAKIYHQRSLVESVFSAIKRKYGERLFTKNPIAQENEILVKILVYNICIISNFI